MAAVTQNILLSLYLLVFSVGFAAGVSFDGASLTDEGKSTVVGVLVSDTGITIDDSDDCEEGDGYCPAFNGRFIPPFQTVSSDLAPHSVSLSGRYELQPRTSQGPPHWSA